MMTDTKASSFIATNEEQLNMLAARLEQMATFPDTDQIADAVALSKAVAAVVRGMLDEPQTYSLGAKNALQNFGNRLLEALPGLNDQRPNTRYQALKRLAVPSFRIVTEKIIRSGIVSDNHDSPILRMDRSPNFELETIFSLVTLRNILEEEAVLRKNEIDETYQRFVKAKEMIDQWDGRISDYDRRVSKLLEDYNFVGFAKAFGEMLKGVTSSKRWSLILLSVIAGFAFIPPVVLVALAVVLDAKSMPQVFLDGQQRLYVLGPALITYEILCIYFFRVALRNFQSAAAQASQLELRLAACAFIQQYAEFSKSQKAETLEKFESLVFSGLAIEPGKVPSTFDGLEQLVAAIRGAKADTK